MSLTDGWKHLPEDLATAIKRVADCGGADVSVDRESSVSLKIVIKADFSDDVDLDEMTLEELKELLSNLKRELDIVLGDEPEDEDSEEFSDWEDMVEDLEDRIDDVLDAIDDLSDD